MKTWEHVLRSLHTLVWRTRVCQRARCVLSLYLLDLGFCPTLQDEAKTTFQWERLHLRKSILLRSFEWAKLWQFSFTWDLQNLIGIKGSNILRTETAHVFCGTMGFLFNSWERTIMSSVYRRRLMDGIPIKRWVPRYCTYKNVATQLWAGPSPSLARLPDCCRLSGGLGRGAGEACRGVVARPGWFRRQRLSFQSSPESSAFVKFIAGSSACHSRNTLPCTKCAFRPVEGLNGIPCRGSGVWIFGSKEKWHIRFQRIPNKLLCLKKFICLFISQISRRMDGDRKGCSESICRINWGPLKKCSPVKLFWALLYCVEGSIGNKPTDRSQWERFYHKNIARLFFDTPYRS
jgi:hypothetical protein